MKITALYSRPAITVDSTDTLRRVAGIMNERNIGALPVLEHGRLAGMVSERDLVRALAFGADLDCLVMDCMSDGAAWIGPDADSTDAAHKMLALGVRHLPVVQDHRILGMLSARDLLAPDATRPVRESGLRRI
jgi:CBS domain-containing protein